MVLMPTPKGAKFTKKHRRNMSRSRKNSVKFQRHLRRLHRAMRGRKPKPEAIAGSSATRTLRRLGTTRQESPEMWERYRDMYLKQYKKQ